MFLPPLSLSLFLSPSLSIAQPTSCTMTVLNNPALHNTSLQGTVPNPQGGTANLSGGTSSTLPVATTTIPGTVQHSVLEANFLTKAPPTAGDSTHLAQYATTQFKPQYIQSLARPLVPHSGDVLQKVHTQNPTQNSIQTRSIPYYMSSLGWVPVQHGMGNPPQQVVMAAGNRYQYPAAQIGNGSAGFLKPVSGVVSPLLQRTNQTQYVTAEQQQQKLLEQNLRLQQQKLHTNFK